MTRYVVGRLLGAVPLAVAVGTLVFFVVSAAPGDPSLHLISPGMTAEVVERTRANFGLDAPLPVRYVKWLGALATGQLGWSFSHGRPVADVVLSALPNTLLLSGCALVVAFLLGTLVGTLQAVRRGTAVDAGLSTVLLFFYAMPSFWLALMLVLVFSLFARTVWDWPIWFPASGMVSVDHEGMSLAAALVDRVRHLVLPVASLALVLTGGVARFVRSSVLEVLGQDYVLVARAKGLSGSRVLVGHALRNALLPLVTLLGLHLPLLFSGTVFVESVFAWPGMGRLIVDAVASRDYPLVMGAATVFAGIVIMGNLVADVLAAVVDPRVRDALPSRGART